MRRKNNWEPTPSDHTRVEQPFPLVIRERPGRGRRHLLAKRDVHAFVELLPDWGELSRGLRAIVLAPGEDDAHGWHDLGTVAVCAWDEGLWQWVEPEFFDEHRDILVRLGVPAERGAVRGEEAVHLLWTEATARAFQLLHILLHELGHHHDRMTTRSVPDRPRAASRTPRRTRAATRR